MNYFLYTRKSTDDDSHQVLSIEAQLAELREFAHKERLVVSREFTESRTAREPGRPVFDAMMHEIESGKASGIIAWHPDRLARNSIDGGRIIYALDTGRLHALRFPTFWFENTPQGKFVLQISFGQSKYYVDSLSENVRRGLRQKLRRGEFPGWAPVGYLNNPREHSIEVDEAKAPLVRRLFGAFASGRYTPSEVRRMAIEWGLTGHSGKAIALSKIPVLLANPFYIGLFRYKGEIHEGTHEPIVSTELFEAVQKVLRRNGRGSYRKDRRFPFRGLVTCHVCGCAITADTQKGHNYYQCGKRRGPCRLKCVREEALAASLRTSILLASCSESHAASMLAEIDRLERDDTAKHLQAIDRKIKEVADLTSRLERLLDVYLEGTITREEYAARKESYVQQKTSLAAEIDRFERDGASRFKPLRDFVTVSEQARSTAFSDDLGKLRDFLKRIGSNLVLAAEIVGKEAVDKSDVAPLARPSDLRGRMSPDGAKGNARIKRSHSTGGEAAVRHDRHSGRRPVTDKHFGDSDGHANAGHSDFIPILPDSEVAAAFGVKPFRSLGSRTDPILHVQFPMPWAIFAHADRKSGDFSNWRCLLTVVRNDTVLSAA